MMSVYENYEIMTGLEIHVELLTETKLFCGCANSFGDKPNINTCPVCAGLPGSLPVLNKKAVQMAMMLGVALNCDISRETHFDRKNYFYPDNPQNYQITQLYSPICTNGFLKLDDKKIRIKEMHLEDDAGKLIHDANITYIDYNRSGVPLIEIVTEPDFTDSDQVIAFLKALIGILKELEICDCKMQEGSLRVDVNISVRLKGHDEPGVRSEIKNINSFTEIRHAMAYEKIRQINELESGNRLHQETRGWDEKNGKTFFMRLKENQRDYRYFCEPDLPMLVIKDEDIENIKKDIPMLPAEKKAYVIDKYKMSEKDAEFLCRDKALFKLYEELCKINGNADLNLKWLLGDCMHLINKAGITWAEFNVSAENLAQLIELAASKNITGQIAKEILEKLFDTDFDVLSYVKENGLWLNSDEKLLEEAAKQVVAENEKSVSDYFSGKDRALQFLIGQGMKLLKGKADVKVLSECILRELENSRK